MATTNIPATGSRDLSDERQRRLAEGNQDKPKAVSQGQGNKHGDDIDDLDKQAREAVEYRASAFFDTQVAGARIRLNEETKTMDAQNRKRREEEFQHNIDQMRKEAIDKAMAVYKGAIERRGRRLAALDQLQGAMGLPADPELRQREVERRTADSDAALKAQSGTGTMMDNLEGRLLGSRIDVYLGDQTRAEFNPHVQEGHGHNIAAMAQASARLQQIAPNAPMTQENVLDPEGAAKRAEQGRASQSAQEPVQSRVAGDNRSTDVAPNQRVDQRGGPGGHPATEGGLMASDPMVKPAGEKAGDMTEERQKRLREQGKAQGLSDEEIRRREQLASGADRE